MKRVALAAILLALALSASASRTSAGAAQTGNDLLQLLPDGHAVLVVDVQRVTTSSLWATLSTQNKIKSELDKAQAEISEMGVNIANIQTVALTFSGEGTQTTLRSRYRAGSIKTTCFRVARKPEGEAHL